MIKHKLISKNNNKSKKINQIIFKFMMTQKTVMNIQKILNINMMMKKMPKTRKMMITMTTSIVIQEECQIEGIKRRKRRNQQ